MLARFFSISLLCAGCLGSYEIDAPGGGGGGGGAAATADLSSASGASDMGRAGGGDLAKDPNCIAPDQPSIDGHHNAGQDCLTCHDGNTQGANKWFAAGTVYDAAGNGKPGITVEVIDTNGVHVSVITASMGAPGNFYIDQPLAFPISVRASACPFNRPMATQQQAGNCNGCHTASMRIHVP